MAEKTKKGDFIEIEYTGIDLLTNTIFDTNIKEEAKKINPKMSTKPLVVCIGEGMVVEGLDEALEDKELGKEYNIRLEPEKAFGKRYKELIKLIPMRVFTEQKVYPEKGMTLVLDNSLAKVVSVSGGRVLVDFNNPLAGKDIEYKFMIKRIVYDDKERINALQKFFFGQEFAFDLIEKEGKKKIIFKDLKLVPILNAFKDKFKNILGFDVEVFEGKKQEKKQENKREMKEEKKEREEKK